MYVRYYDVYAMQYIVLVKDMMFHAEYYDVVYVKDYIISCYNV
jgi:hypothetical protein